MKDGWKNVVKRYLVYLEEVIYPNHEKQKWNETFDRKMLKEQKRIIGEAWRKAENLGGQLYFEGW